MKTKVEYLINEIVANYNIYQGMKTEQQLYLAEHPGNRLAMSELERINGVLYVLGKIIKCGIDDPLETTQRTDESFLTGEAFSYTAYKWIDEP